MVKEVFSGFYLRNCLSYNPPDHIVHADDVLLIGVLCAADDGGTGLEPSVASTLVH